MNFRRALEIASRWRVSANAIFCNSLFRLAFFLLKEKGSSKTTESEAATEGREGVL